jgi:hypothetical protein
MARLRLIQLQCNKTEDLLGADEAYLRVNGAVVWGPRNMQQGGIQALTAVPPIPFFGLSSVELFDQDTGGIFDPDDFLGAIAVSSQQVGQGPQLGSFTGDEANYTLTYEVDP